MPSGSKLYAHLGIGVKPVAPAVEPEPEVEVAEKVTKKKFLKSKAEK